MRFKPSIKKLTQTDTYFITLKKNTEKFRQIKTLLNLLNNQIYEMH